MADENSSQWYLRIGDREFGPIAWQSILDSAREGKITRAAELRNQTKTSNQWVSVAKSSQLLKIIESNTTQSTVPPPIDTITSTSRQPKNSLQWKVATLVIGCLSVFFAGSWWIAKNNNQLAIQQIKHLKHQWASTETQSKDQSQSVSQNSSMTKNTSVTEEELRSFSETPLGKALDNEAKANDEREKWAAMWPIVQDSVSRMEFGVENGYDPPIHLEFELGKTAEDWTTLTAWREINPNNDMQTIDIHMCGELFGIPWYPYKSLFVNGLTDIQTHDRNHLLTWQYENNDHDNIQSRTIRVRLVNAFEYSDGINHTWKSK